MTNNTLAGRGGSELYIRDLAVALRALGHDVVAYSPVLGPVAEEMEQLGLPVISSLDDLTETPDVIHGHHHLDAAAAVLRFPTTPCVYACHGWLPWQEAALTFPLAARYVAVSRLTRERLLTSGIPADRVSIISNFVDVDRFSKVRPPDRPIRRVLAYGNSWRPDSAALAFIADGCERRGWEFQAIGAGVNNVIASPQDILPTFDVVFAMGRSALEAIASGCAVVVADPAGMDGLVTPESLAGQREANFGLALIAGKPVTPDAVAGALDGASAVDVAKVTADVRQHMSLGAAARSWDAQYQLAMAAGPAAVEDLVAGAANYLVALKRTFIEFEAAVEHHRSELMASAATIERLTQASDEAEDLRRNLARTRRKLARTRQKLARTRGRLNRLLGSRSWRFTKPLRGIRRQAGWRNR